MCELRFSCVLSFWPECEHHECLAHKDFNQTRFWYYTTFILKTLDSHQQKKQPGTNQSLKPNTSQHHPDLTPHIHPPLKQTNSHPNITHTTKDTTHHTKPPTRPTAFNKNSSTPPPTTPPPPPKPYGNHPPQNLPHQSPTQTPKPQLHPNPQAETPHKIQTTHHPTTTTTTNPHKTTNHFFFFSRASCCTASGADHGR